MAKKFRDLVATTMSPEAKARAAARTKAMLADMHLQELRRARQLSQEELAERLGASQPEVSKMEGRADMYVSTIRRYIEAMGGEPISSLDSRMGQYASASSTISSQRTPEPSCAPRFPRLSSAACARKGSDVDDWLSNRQRSPHNALTSAWLASATGMRSCSSSHGPATANSSARRSDSLRP